MDKINISEKDRKIMSFFLSFIILSAVFSFMGDITHKVMTTTTTVEGIVNEFTSDSMCVNVNWLVEYEHSIYFTDMDLLEMRVYINGMMKKDVKKLINETSYQEYLILKNSKTNVGNKKIKIILFNN